MQQGKLIELLRTLNAREWSRLLHFANSSYHNRNPEIGRMLNFLCGQMPDFSATDRTRVFEAVYPGEPFDDARLNHLVSFSLKTVERFLAAEAFKSDEFLEEFYILRAYDQRNLDKHYSFQREKIHRKINHEAAPTPESYYRGYLFENLEGRRLTRTAARQYNEHVQRTMDFLDDLYFREKLRCACYMLISQAIIAMPYNLQFAAEVAGFVGKNLNSVRDPATEAYFRIFQLLSKPSAHEDFEALKEILERSESNIDRPELSELYQYAINYCNLQIMKVQERYVGESLELYTRAIELGILLDEGVLSPWHYKNIIKLALRLNRYEWTEQFILEKTALLAPEFREDAWHYNLAELYYYTGRIDEATVQLNKVEFTDIHYTLGAKTLLCKIYFEKNAFDPLDALLHTFNTFLRRNKLISEDVRNAYLHFIRLLRKILNTPTTRHAEIRQEIAQTPLLTEKTWLTNLLAK